MTIKQTDEQYVANTYGRFPVEIISGKGSLMVDTEGKEYIDMGSGIAVTSFGIADEEWQKAVTEQLGKVQHTSNLYYTAPCAMLAEQLCLRTGMKKVFFGNSGAEANECAIKVARKWAAENKGSEYYTIVSLNNSFHGRTLSTLAMTGQDHFHELFQPLTPGFLSVPANDMAAMKQVCETQKVAAVIVECVQGEGGVLPLCRQYAQELNAYLQEKNILLIVDEVQTGNGRTGSLYAYTQFGLQPDVVTTAKGLAGGLPLGACMMSDKVQYVLGKGDHGSTFGGNPVCCAGALSILARIDDKLMQEVKEKSEYIISALRGQPGIESVSGLGLMLGIKTTRPVGEVLTACREQGLLCLTAKDKVRLLPALNIPMELVKKAVDILIAAVK